MRFALLLIAAVVAIVAGVAVLRLTNKPPQTVVVQSSPSGKQEVSTVDVLVARVPIDLGNVIDESMVDRQPWPQHLVLPGFITSDGKNDNIIGKVARSSFQAREPFVNEKLANPNDPSFLAATLPAGHRAMTIATDAVAGVAGYIFPGDRIDVMFTHGLPQALRDESMSGAPGTGKPSVTEVLLSNVRVLAVNLREVAGKAPVVAPASITIEVDAMQVEKLRLAEKSGTLSVALRSLKDKDDNTVPEPMLLGNLTHVRIESLQGDGDVRIVRGTGKTAAPAQSYTPTLMPPSGNNPYSQ